MNGDADAGIESFNTNQSYLRGDFVTGFDTYDASPIGFYPSISLANIPYIQPTYVQPVPAPEIFPTVDVLPTESGTSAVDFEDPQSTAVVPIPVIDPESYPERTVFEVPAPQPAPIFSFPTGGVSPLPIPTADPNPVRIPADIAVLERVPQAPYLPAENVWENTADTDWDKVYDEYVVLNQPVIAEAPVDWGDILGTALGGIASNLVGPQPQLFGGAGATASTVPTKVTVDTRTGQVTPCRRRRRRRLLTDSDLADLSALKTIVGGGQAMNFAVQKAVRR